MKQINNLTGSWKQDYILRQLYDMPLPIGINVTVLLLTVGVFAVYGVLFFIVEPLRAFTTHNPIIALLMIGATVLLLHQGKLDGKTPLLFLVSVFYYVGALFKDIKGMLDYYGVITKSMKNNILFQIKKGG